MKRQTLLFGIFATTILIVPAFAAGDNAVITGVHWGRNAFGYDRHRGPRALRRFRLLLGLGIKALHFGPCCAIHPIRSRVAGWSSLVARKAHNLEVSGSNPLPATKPLTIASTYWRPTAASYFGKVSKERIVYDRLRSLRNGGRNSPFVLQHLCEVRQFDHRKT
jgi:hypothetical protein